MTIRRIVIGVVLVFLGLPVASVLILLASACVQNRMNETIVSSEQEREYLLHVPESYDSGKPTPLVISMHGAMNWPAFQMSLSRWNEAADEHGFIVAYPAGTGVGLKTWFMEGAETPIEMPDVVFISDLIDRIETAYNIDPARIYANGVSNGAGMAFALSCTLSHRIAAIGAVAAAQSLPWSWCADPTPIPMVAFHGTGDRIVPFSGSARGLLNPEPFPDVGRWAADWARRNRCAETPSESAFAADVTRLEYTDCADDATVVLYTIDGGGHTWPGGKPVPKWLAGRTSNGVDATDEMWAFFREHPLRTTRRRPARRRPAPPRAVLR